MGERSRLRVREVERIDLEREEAELPIQNNLAALKPPAHILKAAGLSDLDPDDFAFICVVDDGGQNGKTQSNSRLPPLEEEKSYEDQEYYCDETRDLDDPSDVSTLGLQSATTPHNLKGRINPFTPYCPPPSLQQLDRERDPPLSTEISSWKINETEGSCCSTIVVQVSLPPPEQRGAEEGKSESSSRSVGTYNSASYHYVGPVLATSFFGPDEGRHDDEVPESYDTTSIQSLSRNDYDIVLNGSSEMNNRVSPSDKHEDGFTPEKWESENMEENLEALKKVRRHMPVNIRSLSLERMHGMRTPNGKTLPAATAKKFKRTSILQIVRMHPREMASMKPSEIENLRTSGLTLTERRALYTYLQEVHEIWKSQKHKDDQDTKRKLAWLEGLDTGFHEILETYCDHLATYSSSRSINSATRMHRCPLPGMQCPVTADKIFDYSGDFGFPEGDMYEEPEQEEASTRSLPDDGYADIHSGRSARRTVELRKHYKGNLLKASEAIGVCDALEALVGALKEQRRRWSLQRKKDVDDPSELLQEFKDSMKEIRLNTLELIRRSGLAASKSRRKTGKDSRSATEVKMTNEFFAQLQETIIFMKDWMFEIGIADRKLSATTKKLAELWVGLVGQNNTRMVSLGEPNDSTADPTSIHSRVESLASRAEFQDLPIESLSLIATNDDRDMSVVTSTTLAKTPLQGLIHLSGRSRHSTASSSSRSQSAKELQHVNTKGSWRSDQS